MHQDSPCQYDIPTESRQEAPVSSYYFPMPRYVHNPQLLLDELEQYQSQCKRKQVARSTRKLLILVLLLFAANVGVVVWYLLRYRGLLP